MFVTQSLLNELRELELTLHQRSSPRYRENVLALLHEDFVEIGRSGTVYNKGAILENALSESDTTIWSQDFDLVSPSSDSALLVYKTARTNEQENLHRHAMRSSLWMNTPQGWRLRFHQGTAIEPFSRSEQGPEQTISPRKAASVSYIYELSIPTRWSDNDMVGHLNNVFYTRCIEDIITKFCHLALGIDWTKDEQFPVTAESRCTFFHELSWPNTITARLRLEHLGNTSVIYGIDLFGPGRDDMAATGRFVHVFVERDSRSSTTLPSRIREKLSALQKQ